MVQDIEEPLIYQQIRDAKPGSKEFYELISKAKHLIAEGRLEWNAENTRRPVNLTKASRTSTRRANTGITTAATSREVRAEEKAGRSKR
jgi:hypothetical protein